MFTGIIRQYIRRYDTKNKADADPMQKYATSDPACLAPKWTLLESIYDFENVNSGVDEMESRRKIGGFAVDTSSKTGVITFQKMNTILYWIWESILDVCAIYGIWY